MLIIKLEKLEQNKQTIKKILNLKELKTYNSTTQKIKIHKDINKKPKKYNLCKYDYENLYKNLKKNIKIPTKILDKYLKSYPSNFFYTNEENQKLYSKYGKL